MMSLIGINGAQYSGYPRLCQCQCILLLSNLYFLNDFPSVCTLVSGSDVGVVYVIVFVGVTPPPPLPASVVLFEELFICLSLSSLVLILFFGISASACSSISTSASAWISSLRESSNGLVIVELVVKGRGLFRYFEILICHPDRHPDLN